MKTKDTFALRNFDEQRILSRPFFQKLNLPESDDADILESLIAKKDFTAAQISMQLDRQKILRQMTAAYVKRLLNHHRELEKFMQVAENKEQFDRVWLLRQCYAIAVEMLGRIQKKILEIERNNEKMLDSVRQKEFGRRLKAARRAAGLTQLELALKLKSVTANGYGSWEQGRTEPSIAMIIRLCNELNISADKLLGICA